MSLAAAHDIGRVEPDAGHGRAARRPSAQILDVCVQARGDGAHLVLREPGDAHLLGHPLHLAGARARGVHLGDGGAHERARRAGGARARPPVRSCRSAAWGCTASACRRRWRAASRSSRFGCSPRHRTASRPRRPSRRSRPARRVCEAAPAYRWRRRRNGAWRACPA